MFLALSCVISRRESFLVRSLPDHYVLQMDATGSQILALIVTVLVQEVVLEAIFIAHLPMWDALIELKGSSCLRHIQAWGLLHRASRRFLVVGWSRSLVWLKQVFARVKDKETLAVHFLDQFLWYLWLVRSICIGKES